MNYKLIYDNLMNKARERMIEGYFEKHHIVPRCLGGTDEQDNIVKLTPEEHYLAHQLLAKIYQDNHSLTYAAIKMCVKRPNNKLYGWLRRRHSEYMKSNNPNSQGKARRKYISDHGVPKRKWEPTQEYLEKCRIAKLGDKNPNKNGKARLTKTYLLDENGNIALTFESLKDAEKHLDANHASVYLNRIKKTRYRGYYWCVGDSELADFMLKLDNTSNY